MPSSRVPRRRGLVGSQHQTRLFVVGVALTILTVTAWAWRVELRAGWALVQLSERYELLDLATVPRGARVAVFVAHGDDECYIMAGTLARLSAERDARITLVSLSEDRTEELAASAKVLGLDGTHIVRGLGDVGTKPPEELDRAVAAVLEALDPDLVMSFGPEGITGHPDHLATGMSVWRCALRRGQGMLWRAVLPKEFGALVSTYAAANEPGWGVGPVLRVPLGGAGQLRAESAACYPSEQESLGRDAWKADLLDTEFWVVSHLTGPANAPALHPASAQGLVRADEILVLVHPTATWDLRLQAKPAIDDLVTHFEASGSPVVLLVNEHYPFTYLADRDVGTAYLSSGGEHGLVLDAKRLWFAGGSYGSCLERGVQSAVHALASRGPCQIEVVLPEDAIYSLVFADESIGAVTLGERVRASDDEGALLLAELVQRVVHQYPIGGYPEADEGPSLASLLEGWTIDARTASGVVALQKYGTGSGRLSVRLE